MVAGSGRPTMFSTNPPRWEGPPVTDRTVTMASAFGVRLKVLRQQAGMTQEAIARAANISLSDLTKLEAGRVEPTWGTARALAAALSVSVAEFAVDDAPPSPEKPRRKGKK